MPSVKEKKAVTSRTRVTRRGLERKAQILEVATDMFLSHGFDGVSIDNIVLAVIHFSLAVLFALDSFGINKLGEVPAVGFFGAYAAIVAVLWGLRAFDPKRSS